MQFHRSVHETKTREQQKPESRVISLDLLEERRLVELVDLDEALVRPAEVVDVPGVDVEPEGVYVELVVLEAPLEEAVGRDVLQLLERVDLRELVLDGELVVGIDVGDETAHRRLGLEDYRLVEARYLELLELAEAAGRVGAEPGAQR